LSDAEMLSNNKPERTCFKQPSAGFVYLKGDVVCDSKYPNDIIWTCLDGPMCAQVPADSSKLDGMKGIWGKSDKNKFKIKTNPTTPTVGAAVACKDFDDKVRSADIGA